MLTTILLTKNRQSLGTLQVPARSSTGCPSFYYRAFKMTRELIFVVALLLGRTTCALWGFGNRQENDVDAAKARVVAAIKVRVAASTSKPVVKGVGRGDAPRYAAARDAGQLLCGDGTVLAWDRVNDDYCDCPKDGSDEPGTSACNTGAFHCVNHGHQEMRLASSRVGDGVCDCCDGSDETATWTDSGGRDGSEPGESFGSIVTTCKNTCELDAEAWIDRLAKDVAQLEAGLEKRAMYVAEAAVAKAQKMGKVED
ncbi:unnamed protein product, partial [Choristocarpus tenellus]